jgi:hypothetical protein
MGMKSSNWKWWVGIFVGLMLVGWVRSLAPRDQPSAGSQATQQAGTKLEPKVAAAKAKAPAADEWTSLSAHIYPGVHVYAGKGDGKGSLGDVKRIGNGQVLILLDDGRERWYERRILTSGYFFVKSNDPALP